MSCVLITTGYHLGPLSHYRYIQLNDLNKKEKKQFIKINRWRYWLYVISYGVKIFRMLTLQDLGCHTLACKYFLC